ncbi:MAG: hypothetical protein AAF631_03905, partial [Pseudomonadota bacterium]
LVVGSFNENAVAVFEITDTGALTNVQNISDNLNANFKLAGFHGPTQVTVDGPTFIVAGGDSEDGVSTFLVASNGALLNRANLPIGSDGVNTLGAVTVGSTALSGIRYNAQRGDCARHQCGRRFECES